MLDAKDLAFSYSPDSSLLTGVSLQVLDREAVAILGPSGSGKSTLLALLGGLLSPREGHVVLSVVSGDSTTAQSPVAHARHHVSWIFQTVSLLRNRSALDNVAVPLLARGFSRQHADELARQSLDVVGLGELGHQQARRLSGGEAQRVAIARSVVWTPRLLLADEPTGQLDDRTTNVVIDAMLNAKGRAPVVIATHDPLVAQACDRQFRISGGRLLEC